MGEKKRKAGQEFPGGLAIKDSALSLLWLGFNPWPGNFCMPGAHPLTPPKKTLANLYRGSNLPIFPNSLIPKHLLSGCSREMDLRDRHFHNLHCVSFFLAPIPSKWAEYVLFAGLLLAVCIIFAIMARFYTYINPAEVEAQFDMDEKKKYLGKDSLYPKLDTDVQTQM